VTDPITPRALFSPIFLQSCFHDNESDNAFQRYAYIDLTFSKMTCGRLLDLVQPEVDPHDPSTPKTRGLRITGYSQIVPVKNCYFISCFKTV